MGPIVFCRVQKVTKHLTYCELFFLWIMFTRQKCWDHFHPNRTGFKNLTPVKPKLFHHNSITVYPRYQLYKQTCKLVTRGIWWNRLGQHLIIFMLIHGIRVSTAILDLKKNPNLLPWSYTISNKSSERVYTHLSLSHNRPFGRLRGLCIRQKIGYFVAFCSDKARPSWWNLSRPVSIFR